MARISIDPKKAGRAVDSGAELARKLTSLSQQVSGVRSALNYKISGREKISARLNEAADQIYRESRSTSSLRSGLEQAIARYNQAEGRNVGSVSQKTLGAAGGAKAMGTSGELTGVAALFEKLRKQFEDILQQIGLIPGGSGNDSSEYAGEPVNMCTGNYVNDIWELTLRGDLELSFVRHYNALFAQAGPLGVGWSHSLDCALRADGDGLVIRWGDGRQERFAPNGNGAFAPVFGGYESVVRTEDGHVYTARDGKTTRFDSQGRMCEVRDRAGHSLRFSYQKDRLVRAEASETRWFRFDYSKEGLLLQVTDSLDREVAFRYDGLYLQSVLSADGTVEQYEYDKNGRLSAVINAAGVRILENTFDGEGRVILQRFPDGTEMRYAYQEDQVIFTDRNGTQAVYFHDGRLRHTSTRFATGEESYTYNEQNQRLTYTDLNGSQWRRDFDVSGNVTALTDPLGQVTRYEYDSRGLLTCVTAPDGTQTKMEYDQDGNMTAITDGAGACQRTEYREGRVVRAVDPDGLESVFAYDSDGRVLSITDSLGRAVTHEYDRAGRLVRLTDKNGGASEFEYDGLDRLLFIRNPAGETRWITYSPTGKVAAIQDFDGLTERWTFNEMDMIASYTDKAGRVTCYEYDNMSNPAKITLPNGCVITRTYNQMNLLEREEETGRLPRVLEYDSYGRVTAERRGEECRLYRYDAAGRLTEVTGWDGGRISVERDALGRVLKRTQADGSTVSFTYDGAGRCVAEQDAAGGTVSYEYSPAGRMTARIDAGGVRTDYTYGPDGLLSRAAYADGKYIDFTYDPAGNLTKRALQSGYTEYYDYDSLGRKIRVSDSDGREKRLSYDAAGHVIRTEDSLGRVVCCSYSAAGCLEKVLDEAGQSTHYAYDESDRMRAVLKGDFSEEEVQKIFQAPEQYQKPENTDIHLTTWKRDSAGNVTEIRNALGVSEYFAYDGFGRMTGHTSQTGEELRYRYHPGGLMAETACGGEVLLRCTYDAMKRMTRMEDLCGASFFQYDAAGRLTHTRDSLGHEIDYRLDRAGVKKELTANGKTYLYEYDGLMRLTAVCVDGNRIAYSYDRDGRLARREMPGGLSESYTYTPAGQVKEVVRTDVQGQCYTCAYQYDALGSLSQKTETVRGGEERVTAYQYDALNRLLSVTENGKLRQCFRYDEFGNRIAMEADGVETQFRCNVLNQVTEKICGGQVSTYTYDARGNLITETQNGRTRTFTYNSQNRLVEVEDFDGTRAEYFWDGMGRRLGKVVDGKRVSFVTDFSRNHNNVLSIDGDGAPRHLLWDEALAAELCGGEVRWYFSDELGSVRASADGQGRLLEDYDYDAFGQGAAGHKLGFGFSGLQYDAESESYFAQARAYSPQLGRFLSKDKERYIFPKMPESVNLYAYCRNNPVTFIDPEGTDCYIFYLPEWQGEAAADQKALAQQYGYDTSQVHMIPISSKQDLTNGWNGMGTVNGQPVDIDTVVIDSHANPSALGFGSGSSFRAQDIQSLNSQDVQQLVLYGCNAGHMDYRDTNPAAQFAQKVNGGQVLASDGTVYSSPSGQTAYNSKADNTFQNYLRNGSRDNLGWVEYRYENGSVQTSVVDEKKMYLTEMTEELRRKRGTMC